MKPIAVVEVATPGSKRYLSMLLDSRNKERTTNRKHEKNTAWEKTRERNKGREKARKKKGRN